MWGIPPFRVNNFYLAASLLFKSIPIVKTLLFAPSQPLQRDFKGGNGSVTSESQAFFNSSQTQPHRFGLGDPGRAAAAAGSARPVAARLRQMLPARRNQHSGWARPPAARHLSGFFSVWAAEKHHWAHGRGEEKKKKRREKEATGWGPVTRARGVVHSTRPCTRRVD